MIFWSLLQYIVSHLKGNLDVFMFIIIMKYDTILYVMLQIYCLYKGKFIKSAVLTGTAKGGRFGNSITNLGDLNNDGFEGKSLSL